MRKPRRKIIAAALACLAVVLTGQAAAAESTTAAITVDMAGTGRVRLEAAPYAGRLHEEENPPLPDESELTITGSGAFVIRFTQPGDYYYLCYQTAKDGDDIVYDDTVYEVEVQVTEEDGALTALVMPYARGADVKPGKLSFANSTVPPKTSTNAPTTSATQENRTGASKTGTAAVKTGDSFAMTRWVTLGAAAILGTIALAVVRRKEEER